MGVSQGVEFDQINVNIPDEYKQMYDAAAAIWLQVGHRHLQRVGLD